MAYVLGYFVYNYKQMFSILKMVNGSFLMAFENSVVPRNAMPEIHLYLLAQIEEYPSAKRDQTN